MIAQSRPSFTSAPASNAEHGFVLITALMLIIAVTILGLTAMRGNTLGERMAGYARDRQIAFQSAEAALRDAERDLVSGRISGETGFIAGCSNDENYTGLCSPKTTGTPIWLDLEARTHSEYAAWVQGTDSPSAHYSVRYGKYSHVASLTLDGTIEPAGQPRYIIEAISYPTSGSLTIGRREISTDYVYRITAVGFGRQATTRVMLQSIYRNH
jgi:type IV pilus assembly protein PilX